MSWRWWRVSSDPFIALSVFKGHLSRSRDKQLCTWASGKNDAEHQAEKTINNIRAWSLFCTASVSDAFET